MHIKWCSSNIYLPWSIWNRLSHGQSHPKCASNWVDARLSRHKWFNCGNDNFTVPLFYCAFKCKPFDPVSMKTLLELHSTRTVKSASACSGWMPHMIRFKFVHEVVGIDKFLPKMIHYPFLEALFVVIRYQRRAGHVNYVWHTILKNSFRRCSFLLFTITCAVCVCVFVRLPQRHSPKVVDWHGTQPKCSYCSCCRQHQSTIMEKKPDFCGICLFESYLTLNESYFNANRQITGIKLLSLD